MFVLVSGYVC